jgi:hypothetical protein
VTQRSTDYSDLDPNMQALVADSLRLPEPYGSQISPILGRVIEDVRRRKNILQLVQDSIGELRLDMKYLVFDLESTRRERDSYLGELRRLRGEVDED